MTKPKVILFDLGGVLVELGDTLFPSQWLNVEKENGQQFGLQEWFASSKANDFECGRISPDEFLTSMKQQLSLDVPKKDVLSAFKTWPKGLYPGAQALLDTLALNYQLAILSNTNSIHEPLLLDDFGLSQMVEHVFFSHLMGVAKPEPRIYQRVLEALNVASNEVLFFDDNRANVQAAKALGIQAQQVFGLSDVITALTERGVLSE